MSKILLDVFLDMVIYVTSLNAPLGRKVVRKYVSYVSKYVYKYSGTRRPLVPLEAVWTGRNGSGHARTVANRAGTARMGAVRTGHVCTRPKTQNILHIVGCKRPSSRRLVCLGVGLMSQWPRIHEQKIPAVYMSCMSQNFPFSRIEFIRSKLLKFSAHVYGVSVTSMYSSPRRRGGSVSKWIRTFIACVTFA